MKNLYPLAQKHIKAHKEKREHEPESSVARKRSNVRVQEREKLKRHEKRLKRLHPYKAQKAEDNRVYKYAQRQKKAGHLASKVEKIKERKGIGKAKKYIDFEDTRV